MHCYWQLLPVAEQYLTILGHAAPQYTSTINTVYYSVLQRCTATGSFYPWLSDHQPSSGWATASLTLTMQIIPQNAPQSHRDHHHHGGRADCHMIHCDDFRGDNIICSLASFSRYIWNLFRSDQIIFGTKALQDICSSFRGNSAVVARNAKNN